MKPPVILQVLPRLRTGGVERGTIEIAGAIIKNGGKAIVASEGGEMQNGLAYAGAQHITLPLASKNPLRILRNAHLLEEIIKQYDIDIVHARSRAPAWSAYLAAKRTKTSFVTTFHGVYGVSPSIKKQYNKVMVKGDRVIAVSHFVAEHIQKHYAVNAEHLRVIHRGADTQLFSPDRVRPQIMMDLAKKWRIPDDKLLLLMPGRITRWKGQHVLIEALAKLPYRNFFCMIVGDDGKHEKYRVELEQYIARQGLQEHVRISGNTPYMTEAYMLADIVVAPSINPEAFGRVPVEAQAMGKLVIATAHGGAAETVIHGETGWLVKPGNAEDLSDTLNSVLNMPEADKRTIGNNAMWHVRNHFSAQLMCDKTMDVYQELL